jgi:predicted RNA-binding protein with PIN domain
LILIFLLFFYTFRMPPRARNLKSRLKSKDSRESAPKIIPQNARPKHLIVDGYNLIHSRPEMKKILQTFGTDAARDEFVKAIAILHDYEGWRVTVVWDGRGEGMGVEYPLKHKTFGCVFSPGGISADEVIQGLVENCASRDDVLVATSDGGIRVFIQANGARWMSQEEFWRWVKDAGESLGRAINRR